MLASILLCPPRYALMILMMDFPALTLPDSVAFKDQIDIDPEYSVTFKNMLNHVYKISLTSSCQGVSEHRFLRKGP